MVRGEVVKVQRFSIQSLRYGIAALSLGMIALWGSENLFWTVPQQPLKPHEWLMTWAAYSLAAGAALSGVLWAGLGGWRAAFLGGAVLGFCIEGVIVGTMYDAFPAQIIWTPLAWHALITGLLVLALPRVLARGAVSVQVAALFALGLFGAAWGLYWPSESALMPGYDTALLYLVGLALPVVAAHIALDNLGCLDRPPPVVLWAAPCVLFLLWLIRAVITGSVVVLTCPAMLLATVWIMRRHGQEGRALVFGPVLPVWRHALLLLLPLTVAVFAVTGWQLFGAVAVNVPAALATGAIGSALWIWLLWRAAFRRH